MSFLIIKGDIWIKILSFVSAALLYFIVMAYVVLGILRERRPMLFYLAAAVAFVLAQLAWFLLGKVVCRVRRPLYIPFIFFPSWTLSWGFLRSPTLLSLYEEEILI